MTDSDIAFLDSSATPVEKFGEYLKTRGKRLTHERALIVEEVFSSHEHFDAEQLVGRLVQRKDGQRVSRSTVYRTLSGLEDAGLLRKVARTNDRDVYEHDYGYPQHDHFICESCGKMIEFHNDKISKVLEKIAVEHNFHLSHHRLEAHGLCADCSGPPKGRPSKLDLL